MKTKKKQKARKVKPCLKAYLLDGVGGRLLVTVPVYIGSMPEAPVVVLFENRTYVQIGTSPLMYENVLGGRAKRLED